MVSFSIASTGQQTQSEQAGSDVRGLAIALTSTTISEVTAAIMQTITVMVTLVRKGKNHTVMQGNLFALGIGNNIASFEGQTIGSYRSFVLDWGEIINLRGDDLLKIQVIVASAAAGQVLTCTTVNGVGTGDFIPKVTVDTINTTQGTQTITGGNNVSAISVVSDTTAFDINSITISSQSGYSQQFTTPDFYALMAEQSDGAPPYYAFMVNLGSPVQGVTVYTSNVASSANTYVVVFGGVIDETTTKQSIVETQAAISNAVAAAKPV